MKPVLLIHGYSSDGRDKKAENIYGTLPAELRSSFPSDILELNLTRWISLNDTICIDDVSFAMDRALKSPKFSSLLDTGFHVIIHSTGALVVRNWIRLFCKDSCPIENLIYLAGANFGSGLAHIAQGQLSRWGRLLFGHTGRGMEVLRELELGASKTIDLHLHFLEDNQRLREDYGVREFCFNGSQTLPALRLLPIRYVKEDSSDGTVRTAGCNLNFSYIKIVPDESLAVISHKRVSNLISQRRAGDVLDENLYRTDRAVISDGKVPFLIPYEASHTGHQIGIVYGKENRAAITPHLASSLLCTSDDEYGRLAVRFAEETATTLATAASAANTPGWDRHSQYESHAQVIFRLRDQFGSPIEHYDISLISTPKSKKEISLERCIEDKHLNRSTKGIITFYLRTGIWNKRGKCYNSVFETIAPLRIEVTAIEPVNNEITFVPLEIHLTPDDIRSYIKEFETTIIDLTLMRLPSQKVFAITRT